MDKVGQGTHRPMGSVKVGDGLSKTPEQADYPAKAHLCKVLSVNFEESTVDLISTTSNKPFESMPWSTPFCTAYHSGGINFMPEIDSYCYVLECADGTSFIVGFITNPTNVTVEREDEDGKVNEDASQGGPNFTAMREPMEPGDIILSTADENKICVRKGGIIQVSSTSMAQRLYIPIENVVRDFFQRYEAVTPLGEISWSHASLAGEDVNKTYTTSDYFGDNKLKTAEETPVIVKYSIKDTAQEDIATNRYTVEIRYGRLTKETMDPDKDKHHLFADESLRKVDANSIVDITTLGTGILQDPKDKAYPSDDRKGVLSISIYNHQDEVITYAFQVNRDGNVFLHSRGSIHVEIDRTVYAKVKEGLKIEYGDDIAAKGHASVIEFTKSNDFKAIINKLVFEAVESMKFTSKSITLDGTDEVLLGAPDADTGACRYAQLKDFIENKLMLQTAMGPTPPGSIAAGCTVPADIESAKVKLRK
jgi:hypothetical protein